MSENSTSSKEQPTLDEVTELPRASKEDMALVSRLRAHERKAFALLLERFHGPMLRLARMYVGTQAVAEEVVQETWLGVLVGLPSFEGRASLKTWIFSILANRAKTRGARESRHLSFMANEPMGGDEVAVESDRFLADGSWASPFPPWSSETPERLLHDREMVEQLFKAVEALPARQRMVLTLRDIEGFEAEEVRNILDITETNQRVLLHRARTKVRADLESILTR